MENLHTKDCNDSKVSSQNFESFESKDSDLDESTNEVTESFDTKDCNDSKVSSPNFESFESKDSSNGLVADRDLKVLSRNFRTFDTKDCKNSVAPTPKFQTSELEVLKMDGRSKPRTQKQIDTFQKNFRKSKSIELKFQELDVRVHHLQSLVLQLI